jgi:G3E family GTPase
VGIDDHLLQQNVKEQSDEEIIEMLNGCICCTVRQDLVTVFHKFAKRFETGLKLDGVIIETTGMADPAPVAQTFFVDEMTQSFFRLDGIVTMVDAKHIEQHLDDEKPEGAENEAVEQVAFADRLIINKVDLVPEEADLQRIEKRLRGVNKFAPIIRTQRSTVSVTDVLDIKAFDLQATLSRDEEFLNIDGEHVHDETVSSMGINVDEEVDFEMFQDFLQACLRDKGNDLYRIKGVIAIEGAEKKFVYQAVHMIFQGDFTDEWEEGEPRGCKLTFIGKNLDKEEITQGFNDCLATEENKDKRAARLRFRIGDVVECNTGAWKRGKVVSLFYREGNMTAPYQVELDDGSLIYAPADDDRLIRKPASDS